MGDIITKIKEGNSPTQKFLVEYFPESSEVTKKEIAKIYEEKSQGMARYKNRKRTHSLGYSRRKKGVRFFKRMVNIGYWKEKPTAF